MQENVRGLSICVVRSLIITVDGVYALEVQTKGKRYGCDAAVVTNGRKLRCGLARYCNDGGALNNVRFAPKAGRKCTWGIQVLADKTIQKGQEILVSYGKSYWLYQRAVVEEDF